jgi:hypothetical protein
MTINVWEGKKYKHLAIVFLLKTNDGYTLLTKVSGKKNEVAKLLLSSLLPRAIEPFFDISHRRYCMIHFHFRTVPKFHVAKVFTVKTTTLYSRENV